MNRFPVNHIHMCARGDRENHSKPFTPAPQRRDNTMPAMASKPIKPSNAENTVIPCQLLNRQGEPCGKPGHAQLPAGCCEEHAISIFRAVVAMGRAA